MRLILLTFALVAAAAAIPQLKQEAVNVDGLRQQRDVMLLLRQLLQRTMDDELLERGLEFKIHEHIHRFDDPNTVKYLLRLVELGRIQRKGVPFTTSYTELRKEIALLTRTFLAAKDYETFSKTAAWARLIFNEDQFYKAFLAACLQRDDTKDLIFPAPYEVLPQYYFDTRVIRKAQDARIRGLNKKLNERTITIPANYTAWLPLGEDRIAYFTQDIGLAAWYFYFNLAGWMLPKTGAMTEEANIGRTYVCKNCETGRGASYYYVHQQLLARYDLERRSTDLWPIIEADFTRTHTPFKPHLSYINGLEFPGRDYEYNMMLDKERLVKTALKLESRLKDAIDKGYVTSIQGSLLSLYDVKGLDMLGTLIEGTGRSINPRYYGSLQAVARELLGGAPIAKHFWKATPSALEMQHSTTRDPVFYKLWKRLLRLFKRWQDSLPSYKQQDLIFPGVEIESVKFDKLITYCEEFLADIDSATLLPEGEKMQENLRINTVVERLNHQPYDYELIVNSDKPIENAVVRVYIGPKFDFDCEYCNIRDKRLNFVEIDQFVCDLKPGKNVIERNSNDAPMRSIDTLTKREIYRKVEEALNSHEPFYPHKVSQIFGFPERLALPRGRREGLPLQVFAIISPFEKVAKSYGPVVPPQFQTYHDLEFPDIFGKLRSESCGRDDERHMDHRHRGTEDISGEETHGRFGHRTRGSGEQFEGRSEENTTPTHRDRHMRGSGEQFEGRSDENTAPTHRGRHTRGSGEQFEGRSEENATPTPRGHHTRSSGEQFEGRSEENTTPIHRGMRYDRHHERSWRTSEEDSGNHKVTLREKNNEFLKDYYKSKDISEIIGGAVSLDGRPFGYPLERRMSLGCLDIPNIKVTDVKVYYEGNEKCGKLINY